MQNTIKVERAILNLTQDDLAKKIGVSRQTINSIEKNRYVPSTVLALKLSDVFGKVVSDARLTQLRIAETEKYAHVTYFFNGGVEDPFPGEDRALIPSPRDVATYDLKPEMSAAAVTKDVSRLISSSQKRHYPSIEISQQSWRQSTILNRKLTSIT